jgi:glyoxylase-like metal-dependent hydrolase (beta-lactamase superfamily II)
MTIALRRRGPLALLFAVAICWTYYATARAAATVAHVQPVRTEEGQMVVFDRITWQLRELTKKLPLNESWPTGAAVPKALEKYTLDRDVPPQAIPVPAQIAPDLYLVGQDRVSNLTYMIDCGAEGVAIIDPTYESEFERTVENVEKCGRTRKDIRWVLNTHCHIDHAMADRKFREMGAQILVGAADAEHVEKGTRVTGYYIVKGVTEFPRSKVDQRLEDGETLRLGNKVLEVIHTPGHTPGSISLLLEAGGKNILFAGDTVLYDARLGWQGNPYADNRAYLASLEKLERFTLNTKPLQWDVLLPGHGAIAMDHAYMDVQKARQTVADDLAYGREILGSPFSTAEYRKKMFGRK